MPGEMGYESLFVGRWMRVGGWGSGWVGGKVNFERVGNDVGSDEVVV